MEPLSRRLRALPESHGRTTLIILALILAVGFGLRAYRVVEPLATPGDDSRAYFALSKALYEEGSYGGREFDDASDWSPGAPLIYAASFFLTDGAREGTVRMVELLFGLAAIIVVYLLGRRLNCRPAGLLAAFGVAVYPPFIHSTGALFSEPPAMFTLPAAVLAFMWAGSIGDTRRRAAPSAVPDVPHGPIRNRGSDGGWRGQSTGGSDGGPAGSAARWLLPGLLFGATAMIRPEYLLVGAAFAALALARAWQRGGWRPGVAAGALLAVGLILPVLPWTVRNAVVLDRFVPISTGGGKALYVGTLLPADGEYQRAKALLVRRYLGRELDPGSDQLDRVDPAPLFDRVADRYPDLPRDEALGRVGKENLYDYLGEDPWGYAAMTARKVWRMWSGGIGEAMASAPGRGVQVALVLLGLLGAVALALRRRWWELAVMATPIILVTVVGAATLAAPRRNEVLMTLVFPLAGVALSRAGAAISSSGLWRSSPASSPQS